VDHVASGTDLFRVICDKDMEAVAAKQTSAKYTPEATTWVKIKNRWYNQAVGREDFSTAPKHENKLAPPMSLFRMRCRFAFFLC
jgi:L,D-peptidoglycan transpeptidase YkuD (ErfK/YbiS/YcfS/YnhG family)